MKTLSVKLLQRSDTEKNWESTNPVLGEDELGFVKNSGNFKIGDGSKKWSELPLYESLSPDDRSKLDGIASGANKTTVDSALSSTSTNPVQNKVVNSALAGKSNTNHTHDLSTMINTLTTGTATPNDDDYYVSQYAGGGTTTTTYHRRPLKALFEYIKSKLHKVAISGSYNDLSNKPTIPSVGNGTITIKQAGAVKGSFTTNQSGATTIELTDNNTNTWRDVIDNLTSTATDKSLSAKQGKLLNDNKAEIREWSAQIKCATWSRLCYVKQKGSIIGSSFILNISGTRNSVVYNDTFVIKVHHSQKAIISKISGSTYSTGIQVRVVSDSSGNCYVEMYENVNGATNTTTQTVYCSLIDIACGEITTYTSFTDGSSIPTGFTSNATITTNSNSLQGNLTWGEITGKPAFKTVATSGSYNDLSSKPTIGNGTITVTQNGSTKGTFTLNQTGNATIALTDNNTVYTHPSYTAKSSGLYKVTVDATGHVSAATAVTKADITGLGIPGSDTNTDTKVTQAAVKDSDYTNWRSLIWGASNSGAEGFTPTTVTDQVFSSTGLSVQPSTGTIRATTFKGALSGNASTATNASKVNNHTVNADVPSGAKFTDTVYTHPTTSGNKHIPSGGSSGQILRWSADGTAVWGADNNTTYSNMTAATASAAGKAGLVPAPAAGKQASFLRGDGTWVVPTNTTYSTGTASTTGLTKLYTGTGTATDGTMTQSAITTALNGKAASSHTHDDRYYTESEINTKLGDLSSLSSYGSDVASILKAIIAKLPEAYSGSYSVTPSATAQSLSTSGKVMKDNVSVSAIPYKEESNSSGTTVTIG